MYYVYAYLREDDSPYYIGKGTGDRAWRTSGRTINRPKDKSRIVMLAENLTEPEAFELEMQKIAEYGRKDNGTGILRNLTDGGDGASGAVVSEETKAKISESKRGANHPQYGKPLSEETKRKLSEANSGANNYWYGKLLSEEHKRKLSKAKRGKTLSEEQKRKISKSLSGVNNPQYGKPLSEEQKRKISETMGTPVLYNGVVYPSINKAAEAIGVSKTTILRWMKTGKIQAEKIIGKQ
jgi:hypothetical protein